MPRQTRYQEFPYKIVGDSFALSASDVSKQNVLNMYAVPTPNSLTGDAVLLSFHGLKLWSSGTATEYDRGIYERLFLGKGWKVSGTKLYSFDKNGVQTEEATVAGGGLVSMTDNGTLLIICNGTMAYSYDGTTLTQLSYSFTPVQVDYINNQFIFLDSNGLTHIANVGSTTILSENVFDANSAPTKALAIKVFNQFIFAFDSQTIEPYENTGVGNPPVERANGAIIESTGIANRDAITVTSDALYFLGSDKKPYQMTNFQVFHIADKNPGVSELFDTYYKEDCHLQHVVINGQDIILYIFPTDKKVWAFSQVTGLWFQLDHDIDSKLWLGKTAARLFNKTLVGDRESGNIYELDPNTYQNNGVTMVRERAFRPFSGEAVGAPRQRFQFKYMVFSVETGVGVSDDNPQMAVSYSLDGNRNFSNERWLNLGMEGEYQSVEDYGNYKFRDLAVKIRYTENTRFSLYDSGIWVRAAGR